MANCKYSPKEFIQRAFSPMVAVFCSSAVDKVCQKNNLSFVQLLKPFCTLDKEITFKDPSGTIVSIKKFHIYVCDINNQPPDATVARRLLNESVGRALCDQTVTVKANALDLDVPETVPWFDNWRETFLQVQFPSDHEFTKHYIACILVTSTVDEDPLDTLSNMGQKLQQMLGVFPSKSAPKWFSSSILRYYVLVHDFVSEDISQAQKVYEEMKLAYKSQCCHMLQINSKPLCEREENTVLDYWTELLSNEGGVQKQDNVNDMNMTNSYEETNASSVKVELEQNNIINSDITHPLSPQLGNRIFPSQPSVDEFMDQQEANHFPRNHATCLNEEDVNRVKNMILSFVVDALIPFVETQMQYLNDMVSNKKGVSKSFLSTTKRWFGTNKPASPSNATNIYMYGNESPEIQMRRLADLCFMFCAYTYAFQVYHTAKRDFEADGALLYFAGALEMAALSSFLIGLDIKKAQDYAEKSVITYMYSCRMPQFATRVTLCTSDCLKDLGLYGEAAKHLIQMTSEDSDLRSALLLEQASYCFIKSKKPCMPRKYAFHLVLAGHRFSKAGQKRHSLRCYNQAYQVYKDKNWSLAEDHIHFTIGRLATSLNDNETTIREFSKLFVHPSRQRPAQQTAFLKEYILSLNEFTKNKKNEGKETLPCLEIPQINNSSIKVMLDVTDDTDVPVGCVPASGVTFAQEDAAANNRWWKLEEKLVAHANNDSLPLMFKPTVSFLTNFTNNSSKPVTVIGESINISVDLINLLNIPITLENIELMWYYASTSSEGKLKGPLAQTHCIPLLVLDPDSTTQVLLNIIPRAVGELHITGICYSIVLSTVEGAESLSVTGYQKLKPVAGIKSQSSKTPKLLDPLPDYRLQFDIINSAPCLRVYFENLPSEIFCGELCKITMHFYNVGILPITRISLASNSSNLISLSSNCSKKSSSVFPIHLNRPIEPGQSEKISMYVRGRDLSGHCSIDLLFYYDSASNEHPISSLPAKLKYRLIYHSSHLFVRDSVFVATKITRSISSVDDHEETVNVQLQVKNTQPNNNLTISKIHLHQISMYSDCWKLYDLMSPIDPDITNIGAMETAFILVKARRNISSSNYSDLRLNSSITGDSIIDSSQKPYKDFIEADIIEANLKDNCPILPTDSDFGKGNPNSRPLRINIFLIVLWKADIKRNNKTAQSIMGQHHIRIKNIGEKYTSTMQWESPSTNSSMTTSTSSNLPKIYDPLSKIQADSNIPSVIDAASSLSVNKQLVLIRLKHLPLITHSFSLNRVCCVPVELILQNCSDYNLNIKVEATQKPVSSASSKNCNTPSYSNFTWLGVVQKSVALERHKTVNLLLSAAFTASGTYDLGSQLTVSARNIDNVDDYYFIQSSKPLSLIFVTNKSS